MLASAWRFVKNNKKTILGTATIVGGVAVGLHSYVSSFQQQWQTSASREFVSEVNRKGSHFDDSIELGNSIANRQYQEVLRKIRELFRVEQIFAAVKEAKSKVNFSYFFPGFFHFSNSKMFLFWLFRAQKNVW